MSEHATTRAGDVEHCWTLHAADGAPIGNKTGAMRLGFAVLLKLFQAEGRFPRHLDAAISGRAGRPSITVPTSTLPWVSGKPQARMRQS